MAAKEGAQITVTQLYEQCEILDKGGASAEESEIAFLAILSGSNSGASEKRLTCQLICRYFDRFANLQNQALDSLFALCEDEDVNIRKMVVKSLPNLCKRDASHVNKIADVLTQLLQTDDNPEQELVKSALVGLVKDYKQDTLKVVFAHILSAEDELIRERAVKFLAVKLKTLPADVMNKELEEFIFNETKKVLQDVTGEEFMLFMFMLQNMQMFQSVTGRQQLLALVQEQAELDKPFDAADADRVEQICQCFKQATPYFSKNVQSTTLVSFMLKEVLPSISKLNKCSSSSEAKESGSRLEMLRVLADLSVHCGQLEESSTKLQSLFDVLLSVLPLPPSEAGENEEAAEGKAIDDEPKIEFSELECLMLSLHNLGAKHASFFTESARAEQMKEFKKRLQYAARVIQVYSKKLRLLLSKMVKTEMLKDENKIKVLALRTTANITELSKDLIRSPPIFKATVIASWKVNESKKSAPENKMFSKRRSVGDEEDDEAAKKKKREHSEMARYQPPGGKFSEKVGTYEDTADWPARGRGNWRGRSRGRRGITWN